ncbi:MAG TPA: phosphate ABC transporter substrate-binding protein PstS [Candidatus Eisenbacteria bacterium]|nr:phosphate ABC transporter substrate-binding protein PstS [Candidatus Eisenbacteria bacterium]
MKRAKRKFSWAVALMAIAAFAPGARAQSLTGAGATFPYPIYSKWFDVYRDKTGVTINYQSIGSGAGIQQVKAGTVDFGASDAALSDDRLRELPRPVLHFPTVGGAVVLAYNLPDLKGQLKLTPDVVVDIYMGKITTWNDKRIAAANTGTALPAMPILPVRRSDGSGTTNIFTMYLSSVSSQWKEMIGANTSVSWPAGVGGKGNEGVAGLVRQQPGSIGYVELAYAKQNKLPYALLRNRSGNYVEASPASVTEAMDGASERLAKDVRTPIVNSAKAGAYPISGLTYLLVYRDQKDTAKGKALADFIQWAMHDGQGMVESLDYAKLPANLVKVNEGNLSKLTANGKPLIAAR